MIPELLEAFNHPMALLMTEAMSHGVYPDPVCCSQLSITHVLELKAYIIRCIYTQDPKDPVLVVKIVQGSLRTGFVFVSNTCKEPTLPIFNSLITISRQIGYIIGMLTSHVEEPTISTVI